MRHLELGIHPEYLAGQIFGKNLGIGYTIVVSMTKWTTFLTKHYNSEKSKNKSYSFKQAMVDAAKSYKKVGGADEGAKEEEEMVETPGADAAPVEASDMMADETPATKDAAATPVMGGKGKGKGKKGRKSKKGGIAQGKTKTRKNKKH